MSARACIRLAAAAGALALGTSLVACSAPAASTCPPELLTTANAKATETGLDVTFTPAAVADVEPAALQTWMQSACVIGFSGELNGGMAAGTFSFVTTDIDGEAFALAVEQLGYTGDTGSWTKQDAATPNQADIITASEPSSDGSSIVDLGEVFPEAKYVISTFHFTAG